MLSFGKIGQLTLVKANSECFSKMIDNWLFCENYNNVLFSGKCNYKDCGEKEKASSRE